MLSFIRAASHNHAYARAHFIMPVGMCLAALGDDLFAVVTRPSTTWYPLDPQGEIQLRMAYAKPETEPNSDEEDA